MHRVEHNREQYDVSERLMKVSNRQFGLAVTKPMIRVFALIGMLLNSLLVVTGTAAAGTVSTD